MPLGVDLDISMTLEDGFCQGLGLEVFALATGLELEIADGFLEVDSTAESAAHESSRNSSTE
jgi:hypothetical protein